MHDPVQHDVGAPVPNGDCPLAAKATVTAQVKMSAAVPARPVICSGAMNPAEPTVMPVLVRPVVSIAWAMPKSMTFGPPAVSSTLEGLRSRCTIPAAWIAVSASASPVARPYSIPGSSARGVDVLGQRGAVGVLGDQDGSGAWVSASITRTVHMPWTRVSVVTSRPNLVRNSGSSASSGRSTVHRDLAALVLAEVDDAHPARAQPGGQPVPPDLRRVGLP